MRLIAFNSDAAPIECILEHISEASRPPARRTCPRTPAWENDPEPLPNWDLIGQPEPDVEFDQGIVW